MTNRADTSSGHTEFLKPESLAPAPGYTQVVVVHGGKLVYISGQVAWDQSGKLVGKGDFRAQTAQVFENLKHALAAAGASFQDLVKVNYFVKDYRPNLLAIVREVRDGYVNTQRPPASTLVGVAALAHEEFLIEVEAVAVVARNA